MPHICLMATAGCASCAYSLRTLDVSTCPGYRPLWVPQDEVLPVVDLLHRLSVSGAAVLRLPGQPCGLEIRRQDGVLVCGSEGGFMDREYADFRALYAAELEGTRWDF